MVKMDDVRRGFEQVRDNLAGGWERLRQSAASALTHFRPGEKTSMPSREQVDEGPVQESHGWAMLGGDVFEDERRLVVRLEAPGMHKEDFTVEVIGDTLVVRGEKRFERESTEGRWRVIQCAYGSFSRAVPLPAAVRSDQARASYRDGVLRVELPKQRSGRPARTIAVKVG